ncbi:MAG: M23 family metallopeptidase [Hyphomonadaceae bacterium]|nr:M23 family metallopeptidase [Hyphomonadaceae bacterium]
MFLRDWLLALFVWIGLPGTGAAETGTIACAGQAVQGGLLLCEAPAGSTLRVSGPDGEARRDVPVNADGIATIGLKRAETLTLRVSSIEHDLPVQFLTLSERDDPFRTIEGLDCDKVDARTEEQKAHASRSWVKKQDAFKTFNKGPGARTGFLRPSDGPPSSPFGPARKYIGVGKDGETCEKTSIHRGYDIAIPTGTEIVAPAAGTVTLGDPDLYYEGGTVFLDHGDGLVSVFMHMSEVDVAAGDVVAAGARLGASGNTGRTTGPHLHWAVKWRNPGSEDRSGDFYIDPALLLELDPAG